MFVARSAGRIRLARTLFVLAGLVPACGLAAWAVHLRSPRHRDAVRGAWQRAVGLPLAIGAVSHPRPGVVRGEDVVVSLPSGASAIAIGSLEVEAAAGEWRLRVGRLRCDPAGARLLAGLAREWLERGLRFDRDVVIDVADLAWEPQQPAATAGPRPVRVECVRQEGARAVRIHRPSATATQVDDEAAAPASEVRIVRWMTGAGERPADADRRLALEVEASWAEPLPFALLAAVTAGMPLGDWSLGADATVAGRLRLEEDGGGRRRIHATGRIDSIDVGVCAGSVGLRASGSADVVVPQFVWSDGRLVECEIECDLGAGRVERRFVDALVATVGCRPGHGHAALAAGGDCRFDAASCRMKVSVGGVELTAGPRLGGPLAVFEGRPLVEPPLAPVPASRLAWLLAPPDAAYVPSAGPGAWLLSVMPAEALPGNDGSGSRVSRAREGEPREF